MSTDASSELVRDPEGASAEHPAQGLAPPAALPPISVATRENARRLQHVARYFRVLSDPVRLRLVGMLHERGEVCVQELADAIPTSEQNASKHLAELRAMGFVMRRRDGRHAWYRLADQRPLRMFVEAAADFDSAGHGEA